MTIQEIEKKVQERLQSGTPFSKSELMKTYMRIYKFNLNDPIIDYAKEFDIKIYKINSKLYNIFKRIKAGKRFLQQDVLWLIDKGYLNFKDKLTIEYHKREANYYLDQFKQKNSFWSIVNASSHFRKCNQSKKAIKLIDEINFKYIKNKNLKSALIITQGGAFRDLNKFDEALINAQKGFSYTPDSFYPCTLFGAIYYEKGEYSLGDKWFKKAEKNGAMPNTIDSEIISIYKRAKGNKKIQLKNHLLKIDFYRYSIYFNNTKL